MGEVSVSFQTSLQATVYNLSFKSMKKVCKVPIIILAPGFCTIKTDWISF